MPPHILYRSVVQYRKVNDKIAFELTPLDRTTRGLLQAVSKVST